jgi:hypothetical protein
MRLDLEQLLSLDRHCEVHEPGKDGTHGVGPRDPNPSQELFEPKTSGK